MESQVDFSGIMNSMAAMMMLSMTMGMGTQVMTQGADRKALGMHRMILRWRDEHPQTGRGDVYRDYLRILVKAADYRVIESEANELGYDYQEIIRWKNSLYMTAVE